MHDPPDQDELTTTIAEFTPRDVWTTKGREDALMHWCMTRQIKARELNLVGREDEMIRAAAAVRPAPAP